MGDSRQDEAAEGTAKGRPRRRRFGRILGRFALFFVVFNVVAVGVSQTAWGRERARTLIERGLEEGLGVDAEIESVEARWAFWPPALTLLARGIDIDHPSEGDLLDAEGLSVRPSLGALMRGTIDLASIDVDAPRVHLRIVDGAPVNLPTLPEGEGGPVELPFRTLGLSDAAISVDVDSLAQARLGPLDLRLDVDGPRLAIDLRTERGVIDHLDGREDIEELVAVGALDLGGAVTIDELRFRTPYLSLRVSEGEGKLGSAVFDWGSGEDPEVGPRWRGQTELEVNVARLGALPLLPPMPPFEGRVLVNALTSFDVRAGPILDGEVRVIDGRIDHKWGLGDEVVLNVLASSQRVDLRPGSEVRLITGGGRVGLEGSLELDAERGFPLSVDTRIDIQFAQLIEQLGVTPDTPVWWAVRGQGRLAGTLDPLSLGGPLEFGVPSFMVTLDPHHVRPRQRLISVDGARARGRWRIDDEAFVFEDMRLTTAGSDLRASVVHLGFDNSFRAEVTGTVDVADVGPLTTFELAGRGPLRASITGTFSDPQVRGNFQLRDFRFDGFRLGDVTSDWRLVHDYLAVSLPRLEATKGASRYRVEDLLFDFREHVEVTGTLRTPRLTLADLYHTFGYEEDERYTPYQAILRGAAPLRFTHGFPADGPNGTFTGHANLEVLAANFAGYAFEHGSIDGDLRWYDFSEGLDSALIGLDSMVLRKGEGTVNVAGTIERSNVRLSVLADRIAVRDTEGIGDSFEGLEGHYSVAGQARGTVDVPRLDLDVDVTGLAYQDAFLGDGRAYVRLTERGDPWIAAAADASGPCVHGRRGLARAGWRPSAPLRTREGLLPSSGPPMAFIVCGEGMGGRVAVDMALGFTDVVPARGEVRFANMDLAPFFDGFTGETSGVIELDAGYLQADGTLGGEIRIDEVRLARADATSVAIANDGPITLAIDRGGVRAEQVAFIGEGSRFELSGGADARGRLDMQVDGRVDLGLIAQASSEIEESHGSLRAHIDVGGRLNDPTANGLAEIDNAGLRFADLGMAVEELSGTVRFDERRVSLEDFRGRAGGGRLSMAGSARLSDGGLRQFRVDTRVDAATVQPEDGVELGVNVDSSLQWNQGDRLPRLTGTVDIRRARYRRPIQLSPTLGELYRPQRAEVEQYDPERDRVAIDLRLSGDSALRVQNNLMDAVLRVDDSERPFRIVGTDQRWGVVGSIALPQGTVRFRSTELVVTEGEIRFDDPTRLDPRFDVLATTEIQRQQGSSDLTGQVWRVGLRAHGDLDGFQLDAESQPPLSQEDLMLLLTVGITSAEAQQLQAGDVGGTALEALSAISGVNEEVVSSKPLIATDKGLVAAGVVQT
ncbi:MAG: translocation/assembly module TamB domain-containing protein, partial [Myxococcota bacterium]